MKSGVYKVEGKLFRYDYDSSMVEYVEKASKEELKDEAEWKREHNGRSLYGIDERGYMVIDSIGLNRENWKNREVRNEYLSEWAWELTDEANFLVDMYLRCEAKGCLV